MEMRPRRQAAGGTLRLKDALQRSSRGLHHGIDLRATPTLLGSFLKEGGLALEAVAFDVERLVIRQYAECLAGLDLLTQFDFQLLHFETWNKDVPLMGWIAARLEGHKLAIIRNRLGRQ